jgi:hypothetical protein
MFDWKKKKNSGSEKISGEDYNKKLFCEKYANSLVLVWQKSYMQINSSTSYTNLKRYAIVWNYGYYLYMDTYMFIINKMHTLLGIKSIKFGYVFAILY